MEKLGIIGVPSDWLISCNVDKEKAKEVFEVDLIDITTEELIDTIKKHHESAPNSLMKNNFDPKELDKAYQIYLALEDIVQKYDLAGFTIRCFDLLTTVHSTSCLALALINDTQVVAACEGDVPALLSMYTARKVLNKSCFQANPSLIDTKNNDIILAHCTLPLNMTTSYKYDTHYESKIGLGIKGELKETEVNVFRISADLDEFVCLEGKIVENLSRNNLCRTQIRIHLKDDVSYYLQRPLGNHHLIIYGDNKDKLKDYLESKGLKEVK